MVYNVTASGVYGVCCRRGSCNGCPPYISASCGGRWRYGGCGFGAGSGCCNGGWAGAYGGGGVCGSGCGWNPPSYATPGIGCCASNVVNNFGNCCNNCW